MRPTLRDRRHGEGPRWTAAGAAATALAVLLYATPGRAQVQQYEGPRGALIGAGAAVAAAGVAGLVGGVLLLRGTQGGRSRARLGAGSGTAVLGGILLPLGLSLVAAGTQRVPEGTTIPRDSSMMVTGGLVSTVGGAALGGGTILVARERRRVSPTGVALLGVGNVLIGVGLPLWVRGAERVPARDIGQQEISATSGLRIGRTPF